MKTKFTKELEHLVDEGVISTAIASNISNYYATQSNAKPSRLFQIFGVFGALLVGSGILLMIAHNWDNLSRIVKTVFAFMPLVIGQGLVGYAIAKEKSSTWKETSSTFLCFGVACCISLVSQIYHVPGETSSFLLTWIALSIPVLYLARSRAVAIIIILASTYYATEVGYWNYRNRETPWLFIVLMLTILPFYWIQLQKRITSNTTILLNWLLPLSMLVSLGTFMAENDELGFVLYITFFGMCYTIGRLPIFEPLKKIRNGFLIIGSLGMVVSLLLCTYEWTWQDFDIYSQEFYSALVLAAITIAFSVYSVLKTGIRSLNLFHIALVLYWGLFFLVLDSQIWPASITNLLVLALGIDAIRKGANSLDLGMLNYGLVIISVLISCRFFDTHISFIIKGVFFIAAGIGFFVANYILLQKVAQSRKQIQHIDNES